MDHDTTEFSMKSATFSQKTNPRRSFSPEFRAEAIRLAQEPGQVMTKLAKNLNVTTPTLRAWMKQAEVDGGRGPAGALTTAEKQELVQLRRENKQLRMEREILKKATAFFAKEQM